MISSLKTDIRPLNKAHRFKIISAIKFQYAAWNHGMKKLFNFDMLESLFERHFSMLSA